MRSFGAVVAALACAAIAACGGGAGDSAAPRARSSSPPDARASFRQPFGDAEAYPVVVSSELVVGRNRFQLGVMDSNDAPIGSRSMSVAVRFFDLAESAAEPASSARLRYVETAPGRGVYVGTATFERAGEWGAEVSIDGDGVDSTVRTSFRVADDASTPAVGERVPASDTPTLADVDDLSEISTDSDPDPSFYRTSIAQALRARAPFVVVFATPKFCQSAVCAPTLDTVQRIARDYDGVTFVHVEVYENLDDPSNLEQAPSVGEWGLRTEPWVFVVGADGRVVSKYEGSVTPAELRADLERLPASAR
ncbi:MAG TPA: hypothetical protein VHJ34_04180 [Actinomycetota bacterium]|nr:hypothetical protein [Actinomycetota bacterium]